MTNGGHGVYFQRMGCKSGATTVPAWELAYLDEGMSVTWLAPADAGRYGIEGRPHDPGLNVADQLEPGEEVSVWVVKVLKLQYNFNGGADYWDVPDPLYVEKGATVYFKAIRTDAPDWPAEKPVWTGASRYNAERDEAKQTFVAVGRYTVSAECWNTVAVSVVVPCELSATDLYGTVPEETETNPGAYVHFNLDNDNANTDGGGNPIADYTETGPVTGENDLPNASIVLAADLDVGTVTLTRSSSGLRVWKSATKGAGNEILVANDTKSWNLADAQQRADLNAVKDNLHVEGCSAGIQNVTVSYYNPGLLATDTVKYTFIAALCGRQPNPAERSDAQLKYPNLLHCEWSITGEATPSYNCIAWSVGITTENIWWQVDSPPYGDGDGVLETTDFDGFYAAHGFVAAAGPDDATILLYKNPADQSPQNPDGISHAARKNYCTCGGGKWIMFSSKEGEDARTEHRRDQLNGGMYGSHFRYYKPE